VLRQYLQRVHVIHRYAEEAVHLRGVQRHGQDAVRAGRRQQIGDETRGNRNSRCVLLV
jgi:hypothetical protein